jgi:hypothetical protein
MSDHTITIATKQAPIDTLDPPTMGTLYRWECSCEEAGRTWRANRSSVEKLGQIHVLEEAVEAADAVPDVLRCECGATDLCIAYRTPVYAYVSDGAVTRVVVPEDQGLTLSCVVRCLTCDRFWTPNEMPDMGTWPAWGLGEGR